MKNGIKAANDNSQSKIPTLNPFQLDDYLFSSRQSPDEGFYGSFHIERIENYKNHLKLPILPHRRSVNFFVYIREGCIVRSKLLNNYEIKAGHFFFLPTDMTTTLESVSEDATGFYCHFTAEFFQQAAFKVDLSNDFPFFQLTADPLIKISNSTRTEQLLQILFEENAQNDKKRIPFIQIYLLALLSEIKYLSETQSYEKKVKNAATYLTERYQNALSTRIYDKTSIVEFAEYLNVTPNHLHKCVKAVTGKSAHDLLADMRILESKVLLKQSNLSIGEIAYRIGKFDQSDFARFFKSKTNLTPNQYRQGTN